MHSLGLAHLDLKPSNIMFKEKEKKEIVLVDFGVSNFFRDNKCTKIFGITPEYCPPEITFNNLSLISSKADIFSV